MDQAPGTRHQTPGFVFIPAIYLCCPFEVNLSLGTMPPPRVVVIMPRSLGQSVLFCVVPTSVGGGGLDILVERELVR